MLVSIEILVLINQQHTSPFLSPLPAKEITIAQIIQLSAFTTSCTPTIAMATITRR